MRNIGLASYFETDGDRALEILVENQKHGPFGPHHLRVFDEPATDLSGSYYSAVFREESFISKRKDLFLVCYVEGLVLD